MKLIFSCLLILSWPGTEKLRAIETSPAKKPSHEVFEKRVPESPDDLIAIEEQVRSVLKNSKAATVCVQGNGSGSGVIISEDGLVLTAGHVSGEPGKKIHVVLQDGTKLKAKALGRSAAADSGLIRITEKL